MQLDECDVETDPETADDRSRLACILGTPDSHLPMLSAPDRRHLHAARRSTAPGQYWHCDTIEISGAWQGFTKVLIIVDDFLCKIFVYAMKTKRQEHVVAALKAHFLREATAPQGVKFYTARTVLWSEQGSEFVSASVQEFCDDIGCTQEFSCPGGGKLQNGVVERQIRNLKDADRSIMATSGIMGDIFIFGYWPRESNPGFRGNLR